MRGEFLCLAFPTDIEAPLRTLITSAPNAPFSRYFCKELGRLAVDFLPID